VAGRAVVVKAQFLFTLRASLSPNSPTLRHLSQLAAKVPGAAKVTESGGSRKASAPDPQAQDTLAL